MERKKVLVVEDDYDIRELLRDGLSSFGYSVDTASDGFEALGRIGQGQYGLIVSDMHYPEFERFISAVAGKYTVIAMTGEHLGDRSVIERMKFMKAAEVMAKPFTLDALREAVSRHYPKD